MHYENIHVASEGAIAIITIDRPKALNALDGRTIAELHGAVEDLAPVGVRAAILTGAGEKAFVAGADIAEMKTLGVEDALRFAEAGHALMRAIEKSPVPFVAAVNGFALGGGCELALACDFIYASTRAVFGQPEVALGVIPGFGGTRRLAARVGVARARELIYTGRRVPAEEALRIGLCNAVFEPTALAAEARKTGLAIADQGPLAVAQAKRAILADPAGGVDGGLHEEARLFAELFKTVDQREGMAAFLEKRKPTWTWS
jgi:enoyl-CoA hydratase